MTDENQAGVQSDGPAPAVPHEPGATLWIALGLGALGFTLGFTTALSVHAGISGALLTGVFSFVAGTLLTFGGFRLVRAGRVFVSTRRVGIGVFAFSIGILLGEPAGISVRAFGTEWLQTCAPQLGWAATCRDSAAAEQARREDVVKQRAWRDEEEALAFRVRHAKELAALESAGGPRVRKDAARRAVVSAGASTPGAQKDTGALEAAARMVGASSSVVGAAGGGGTQGSAGPAPTRAGGHLSASLQSDDAGDLAVCDAIRRRLADEYAAQGQPGDDVRFLFERSDCAR
jgi:hypothetical protein